MPIQATLTVTGVVAMEEVADVSEVYVGLLVPHTYEVLTSTYAAADGSFTLVLADARYYRAYILYISPERTHTRAIKVLYLLPGRERMHITTTLRRGDANVNGFVGPFDIIGIASLQGADASVPRSNAWYADSDRDGTVGASDLVAAALNYGGYATVNVSYPGGG